MWVVLSVPPGRLLPITVSAASQPSRHRSSASRKNQLTTRNDPKNHSQRGAVTNQLSGLDVLWAMQKAADEKRVSRRSKKSRNRDESEPESGRQREEFEVDYSNIRPLVIKDEWGSRLDDLEKRLQQLSDTK